MKAIQFIFVAVLAMPLPAFAQTGGPGLAQPTLTPPTGVVSGRGLLDAPVSLVNLPRGKATKGFTATISLPDSMQPGYQAIEIVVRSNATFTSDRSFVVRLKPLSGGHSPPQNLFTVDVAFSVEQGTKTSTSTHYVPKWTVGNAYEIQMLENGQQLDGYTTQVGILNFKNAGIPIDELFRDCAAQWVYLKSFKEDHPKREREILATATGLPLLSIPDRESEPVFWSRIEASGQYREVDTSDLPVDWRGLQSIDTMLVSTSTVQKLRESEPERYQAVRNWILCGGCVVVLDSANEYKIAELLNFSSNLRENDHEWIQGVKHQLDDEFKKISEELRIGRGLVVDAIKNRVNLHFQFEDLPGWQASDPSIRAMSVVPGSVSPAELERRITTESNAIDAIPDRSPGQWDERFCLLIPGAGLVVGIAEEGHEGVSRVPLWRIVKSPLLSRKSAMLRRGVDPILGDSRARRWLIPGVAEPPVYTFMGLLGVFVVLVGPVAYRKTAKQNRSHLMFAIAPILAITTTLAMFGYGIVADGFGTSARVRQLTWVDGASGDAGQRVKATYFAGISPGEGLSFPADAESFLYKDPAGKSWEEIHDDSREGAGVVTLTDSRQHFSRTFLPSRQQQQFDFHRPRSQIGSLSVSSSLIAMKASSTFEFPIHEVMICDAKGRYWQVDKVGAGQKDIVCRALKTKEASELLGDLYLQYRPISLDVDSGSRSRRSRSRRNETTNLIATAIRRMGVFGSVTSQDGLFEQRLQAWLQTDTALPPSTFISLADVSEDVIAVKDCELVDSVHYVFGTLAP